MNEAEIIESLKSDLKKVLHANADLAVELKRKNRFYANNSSLYAGQIEDLKKQVVNLKNELKKKRQQIIKDLIDFMKNSDERL